MSNILCKPQTGRENLGICKPQISMSVGGKRGKKKETEQRWGIKRHREREKHCGSGVRLWYTKPWPIKRPTCRWLRRGHMGAHGVTITSIRVWAGVGCITRAKLPKRRTLGSWKGRLGGVWACGWGKGKLGTGVAWGWSKSHSLAWVGLKSTSGVGGGSCRGWTGLARRRNRVWRVRQGTVGWVGAHAGFLLLLLLGLLPRGHWDGLWIGARLWCHARLPGSLVLLAQNLLQFLNAHTSSVSEAAKRVEALKEGV